MTQAMRAGTKEVRSSDFIFCAGPNFEHLTPITFWTAMDEKSLADFAWRQDDHLKPIKSEF
jgi:hypothetical protein